MGFERGDLEEALRAEDLRREERSLREAIARASELRSEKERGRERERTSGFDRLTGFMLLRYIDGHQAQNWNIIYLLIFILFFYFFFLALKLPLYVNEPFTRKVRTNHKRCRFDALCVFSF